MKFKDLHDHSRACLEEIGEGFGEGVKAFLVGYSPDNADGPDDDKDIWSLIGPIIINPSLASSKMASDLAGLKKYFIKADGCTEANGKRPPVQLSLAFELEKNSWSCCSVTRAGWHEAFSQLMGSGKPLL